jgi:hypothetical protein
MSRDSQNWARTVGAFQEVYKSATTPNSYGAFREAPVVDEQTKLAGQRASERAYDAAKAGQDFTENFMSNSSVGGKEANAAGNSLLAQGFSKAEAAASARYAGQAAKYFAENPDLDPLTGQKKVTPEDPLKQEDPLKKDEPPVGGGPTGGGTPTSFINPVTVATASVNEQILALQTQIAAMQSAAAAEAAKPKVVGQKTVRKTGGVVEVYQQMSDGTLGSKLEEYKDFGAKDSVMKMFENTGLGQAYIDSLMSTIDKVYEENIMPTDAQVLNSIYNSQAYKTRFAANEAIKKRMADGKGRPGDRLLTPYEYIQTEKAYEEILREAGLPTGFYDQQEDFTNFISAGISTAELTDRVNIARNALNNADEGIKTALKDYYGLTNEDLTAYLLDKDRAINLIDSRFRYTTEEAKKMYTSAEIGGAALRAGQMSDKAFAEEIYTAGKAGQAESAFQTAATQQRDYRRLMGLYGETAGEQDIAREELALAGGTDVSVKKKKLASKERAMFQQKSAIDTSSLGRRSKTADV